MAVATRDMPQVQGMQPEVARLLAQTYGSTEAFCKFFMPDRFSLPFSEMHRRMFRLIDDDSVKQVAIAAPRGIGKTSVLNLAVPLRNIVYRAKRFIMPISSSEAVAMQHSDNLKRELRTNEWLKKLRLVGPLQKEDVFSAKRWVALDTMVLPRGMGQQARGWLFRDKRPDLILVDDLEDHKHMKSEEYRADCQRYFFNDLMNAVDRSRVDWKVIYICTISHPDCLFMHLRDDPMWKTIAMPLRSEEGDSVWPEFMSTEDIAELEKSFAVQGMLEGFYQEYLSEVFTGGEHGFNTGMFKYYGETEHELNSNMDVESAVIIDPAQTMKEGSAHTAILGASIDTRTNKLYIREVIHGLFSPDWVIDETFGMAERIKAAVIAPEVSGAEAYIVWPIESEMLRRGKPYWELVKLRPRDKKEKRVGALRPLYVKGLVYHNSSLRGGDFEIQLLSFPRPKRWDMIDAAAHIIPVFYEGQRYFSAPEETQAEIEAEYRELHYDEQLVMDLGI